jgi:hypothetical protein
VLADKFWSNIVMSAKGNAPNRRVAAIQAKKKRKQPKKSKTVGEGGGPPPGKDRDRPARETRQEQEQSRSFEEVRRPPGRASRIMEIFHFCDGFDETL